MTEDPIFEALLQEAAGNDAPDVRLRVLQAATEEGLLEGEAPAAPSAAPVQQMPEPERRMGSLIAIIGWAAAACAIVALGWVLFSRPAPEQPPEPTLPPTVAVIDNGQYEIRDGGIHLSRGVALVREGAPTVYVGENAVSAAKGMALVSPGGIPGDRELNELETQLRRGGQLKPEEIEMLKNRKRWIISGGVALCVLAGSVALNGDVVEAQMRLKHKEKSKSEKVEGEKAQKEEGGTSSNAVQTAEAYADNILKKWDKNEDGFVTLEESNEEVMSLDENEDGKVTREEMESHYNGWLDRKYSEAEAAKKKKAEAEKAAAEQGDKLADDFFSKVDKDNDGVVSSEEAKNALGAEADALLKKLDSDGNGEVSKDEAKKFFSNVVVEEDDEDEGEEGEGIAVGGAMRKSSSSGGNVRKQGEPQKEQPKKEEGESSTNKKSGK